MAEFSDILFRSRASTRSGGRTGNGGAKVDQGGGVMVALRAAQKSATLALSSCGEGGGIFNVEL